MRTHNSRIIPVFLCLLCLLALLPAPVRAAGPIDPTQEVCLTIHNQHDRQPVSGVPFDLFYVASVDAYGEFTLTGDFAGYPGRLTGLDSDGWRMLAETLAGHDNLEIVFADVLKTDLPALVAERAGGRRAVACANLPYYITTDVLTQLLSCGCFSDVTVMIQKEVAQRIAARAGTAEYGAFSVF